MLHSVMNIWKWLFQLYLTQSTLPSNGPPFCIARWTSEAGKSNNFWRNPPWYRTARPFLQLASTHLCAARPFCAARSVLLLAGLPISADRRPTLLCSPPARSVVQPTGQLCCAAHWPALLCSPPKIHVFGLETRHSSPPALRLVLYRRV